jgi:hypothetical protein
MLVKAIQPVPPEMTEALGIHQSDIVIRSALIAGIADLRANPWLLKYVFASLPRDEMTMADYGEMEVSRAEEWFLKTDIPVFMTFKGIDDLKFPCISIALQESTEAEATLGDVHYVPLEQTEAEWPVLAGPFRPAAYNPGAGLMKIPAQALNGIILAPGMVIIDGTGRAHSVLGVVDDDTISIAPGTVADFSEAMLKGSKPQLVTALESISVRETYQIGLHAHGEATHLTYLYSIVAFILSRYKETMLEARGFERSTVAWSNFQLNQLLPENVYSRFCTITGYVRNYWPKLATQTIDAVSSRLDVSVVSAPGEKFVNEHGSVSEEDSWLADADALLAKLI